MRSRNRKQRQRKPLMQRVQSQRQLLLRLMPTISLRRRMLRRLRQPTRARIMRAMKLLLPLLPPPMVKQRPAQLPPKQRLLP